MESVQNVLVSSVDPHTSRFSEGGGVQHVMFQASCVISK